MHPEGEPVVCAWARLVQVTLPLRVPPVEDGLVRAVLAGVELGGGKLGAPRQLRLVPLRAGRRVSLLQLVRILLAPLPRSRATSVSSAAPSLAMLRSAEP